MLDTGSTSQKRIVYSLVWFFTIFIGGLIGFHLWSLRDLIAEKARNETFNMTVALKEFTERRIDNEHENLQAYLSAADFVRAFHAHDEKYLFEKLRKNSTEKTSNQETLVISEDGEILAGSLDYPVKKVTLATTSFFQFHLTNASKDIYVGEIIKSPLTDDYKIPLSMRITNPNETFAGVLVTFLDPRSFQALYQDLSVTEEDSIVLLDKNGRFLTRFPWEESVVGVLKTRQLQILTSSYNVSKGFIVAPSTIDGRTKLISFYKFDKYPMIAVASRLRTTIFAELWKSIFMLVPLYALSVLLVYALGRAYLRFGSQQGIDETRGSLLEETVRMINSHTSKEIGLKFLERFAAEISRILKCRYVFVGTLNEDLTKVHTIASSKEGEAIENVEYDLKYTPCEGVIGQGLCYYPSGVQELFPKDHFLVELKLESYIGVPLFDSRGRILGILVGAHDGPMPESSLIRAIFGIFAARAGAEIERIQTEKSRLESEEIRRKLEGQTLYSQKMESIGRLAGGIAHDFNNILAAITANLEYAKMKVHDPRVVTDYLGRAEKASQRARDLVRQILTFGRSGAQETKPLDLSQLIQEVGQILRAGLGAHIEIRTLILDTDVKVLGSITQLHQVLMNLCTNAAQAIHASNGLIEITLEKEADQAKLKVRDNGVGMDEETRKRIFEPFFTTKVQGQGTGLGLPMVQGIVKQHGGTIEVHSKVNFGSEFIVYLPLYKEDGVAVIESKGPENLKGYGQCVLVVDDESTLVELTGDILSDNGYQTEGYSKSEEAFQAFLRAPYKYSLVVTDITMPGMRGEELIRKIHDVRKDIPVIFTTGLDTELNQLQQIEGPFVTLQKPFNLWTLVETVGRLLKTNDASGQLKDMVDKG